MVNRMLIRSDCVLTHIKAVLDMLLPPVTQLRSSLSAVVESLTRFLAFKNSSRKTSKDNLVSRSSNSFGLFKILVSLISADSVPMLIFVSCTGTPIEDFLWYDRAECLHTCTHIRVLHACCDWQIPLSEGLLPSSPYTVAGTPEDRYDA